MYWREGTGANIARIFTHPVDAALDHPPFAARKEGKKLNLMTLLLEVQNHSFLFLQSGRPRWGQIVLMFAFADAGTW
jgi:hypothetical protein